MRHQVSIETRPKSNRRVDPPRSWWYCTCGAGDPTLVNPVDANAAADRHLEAVAMAGPPKIGLVGCSGLKVDRKRAPARELYMSPLFRKSLQHALARCGTVYIVSAKYHLVELDQVVENYDQRMAAGKVERLAWGERVARELLVRHAGELDRIVLYILAGQEYAAPIVKATLEWWPNPREHIVQPLDRLELGQRLRWLNENKL